MIKSIILTVIGCCMAMPCFAAEYVLPALSPDGETLIVSDFPGQRFMVISIDTGSCLEVTGTLTAGRMARWSPDGTAIGFKIVTELPGNQRLQAPAILNPITGEIRQLSDFVPLCGNPSFAGDGSVAFTIGAKAVIMNVDLDPVHSLTLPGYTNSLAVNSQGKQLAYSTPDDTLFLYTRATDTHTRITAPGYCRPIFSPDEKQLLVSTLRGELSVFDLTDQTLSVLGPGDAPTWLADSSGVVCSERVFENDRLKEIRLMQYGIDGSKKEIEVPGKIQPVSPVVRSGHLCFIAGDTGAIYQADLRSGELRDLKMIAITAPSRRISCPEPGNMKPSLPHRAIAIIPGVPYLHQVYCTPGGFNGHWACNGTAAVMCLGYYGILADWDFTATSPFTHTSHYGNYISEIYSYNGHTYNTGSPDAGGTTAYGAYGYIVQNDWEDTKGHMQEYISYHAITSPSVDWSPTWAELQTEVANRHPFVLLSSITASGHYKTVVGYHEGQHTIVFNDPYGNDNTGYMNFNGAGVSYDWPGYNNGYTNLNNVWCYIYARSTVPAVEAGTVDEPIEIPGFPYSDSRTTRCSSGSDIFDEYDCAVGVNEEGREIVYRFTVTGSGEFTASLACDQSVDIDVHLLSAPAADSCLARGHISLTEPITAGTYWLTCDTWTDSNIEYMGDYTLTCTFSPDATATPVATHTPPPTFTPTPVPTHTPVPPTFTPIPPTATFTPPPPTATPSPEPTATPPCLHHGDVTFDGTISAGDAQLSFWIALAMHSPTFEEFCAADCNGDGSVTAGDTQLIFQTGLALGECVDSLE